MKLTSVRITNFKSINDSGSVSMPHITCLVGKNESGKTAFLQALYKLNPITSDDAHFDELMDYPRRHLNDYQKRQDKTPASVVMATFTLSDPEIATIELQFGRGSLTSHEIVIRRDYADALHWELQVSDHKIVEHLITELLSSDDVDSSVREARSVEALKSALQALPNATQEIQSALGEIYRRFPDTTSAAIAKVLEQFLPHFVYFSDYSSMPGRISIPFLKGAISSRQATPDERTFLALLDMVGLKLDQLENEQNFESVKAQLEAAAAGITDEVFTYWSQNKQLQVTFDLFTANPKDAPPLNSGRILNVRIWNQRHRVSVAFDERSKGFVWFFSFLVYFSQLENRGRDLILLLDEPGLSLHAAAQADFLRLIEERLGPRHQVIYTTHSPFMVDPHHLERVRTVQDIDDKGTVLTDDILRNDADTVFPLQAALGYGLTQTLFLGPNCLLVEGTSDLIYIQIMSDLARTRGQTPLDGRWTITPVGGADKVATFVSLLGASDLNIAVLMDISSKGEQRINALIERELLTRSHIFHLGDILDVKSADIEDMFELEFYLTLVTETYGLGKALNESQLPEPGNPRITRRLEQYFKVQNVNCGDFSHLAPANCLVRQQQTFIPEIKDQTIERFVSLFERINALLP